MLPLLLDLTGRLALVVGAGPVGRRKAAAARAAGARLRVVCLAPRPPDWAADDIDWLAEPYEPRHLDGAALAFAAAPPDVNARVARDARARGVWVNVASDPAAGDLALPAVLRRGGLTVAVSTAGAAPALARAVRDRLADHLDPLIPEWLALLADLRPLVLASVPDEPARRELFANLAAWPWLDRLRAEGPDAVRAAMRQTVLDRPGAAGPSEPRTK